MLKRSADLIDNKMKKDFWMGFLRVIFFNVNSKQESSVLVQSESIEKGIIFLSVWDSSPPALIDQRKNKQ